LQLAQELIKRDCLLPDNREELEKMPYMGQYIANAVELLIYGRPLPLIDVNMARILERYFGLKRKSDIRFDPILQNISKKVVDHEKAKEINWAILDYAALICKAQNPKCLDCVIKKHCQYFISNK
jgi:A/G-specific adenine glycosylase